MKKPTRFSETNRVQKETGSLDLRTQMFGARVSTVCDFERRRDWETKKNGQEFEQFRAPQKYHSDRKNHSLTMSKEGPESHKYAMVRPDLDKIWNFLFFTLVLYLHIHYSFLLSQMVRKPRKRIKAIPGNGFNLIYKFMKIFHY